MLKIKINVWGHVSGSQEGGNKGVKGKGDTSVLIETNKKLAICCQTHPHQKRILLTCLCEVPLQRILHGHDPFLARITSERSSPRLKSQGSFRPSPNNRTFWQPGSVLFGCLLSSWIHPSGCKGYLRSTLPFTRLGHLGHPPFPPPASLLSRPICWNNNGDKARCLVWIGLLNLALIWDVKTPSKPESMQLKYQRELEQDNFSFLMWENWLAVKYGVLWKTTEHVYRNTEVTFLV